MLMSRCELNISGTQTIQNYLHLLLVCLRNKSSKNKMEQLQIMNSPQNEAVA